MLRPLNWKAGILAGLIAGVVFLMVEMPLMVGVDGAELWGPPRMMAGIVLGEGAVPPPATFDAGIVAMAMVVHFGLSVVYGIVLGWAVSYFRLGTATATLLGAAFGLIIYFKNFYGMTEFWPWFSMARGWILIVSHLVFGAVLGWAYRALAKT
jgi:uncharacterized membrane protein YagU involved in acid resistance